MSYNDFDFFGMKKKQKKTAQGPFFFGNNNGNALAPSRPLPIKNNYWGLKSPKMNNVSKTPRSFIGKPSKAFNFGNPLYKKERIGQKHLSKWGDVDMDGSPNYFDCDPVNFLKDAKPLKKGKTFKITADEYYKKSLEKQRQRERYRVASPEEKLKMTRGEIAATLSSGYAPKEKLKALAAREAVLETRVVNLKKLEKEREKSMKQVQMERQKRQRENEKAREQRERESEAKRQGRMMESEQKKAEKTLQGYKDVARVKLGQRTKKLTKLGEKKVETAERVQGILQARKKSIFTLTTPGVTELGFITEQKIKKGKMPTTKEMKKLSDIEGKKFTYKTKELKAYRDEEIEEPVIDKFGNPVLDENGQPLMEKKIIQKPVYEEKTHFQPSAVYRRAVSIGEGTSKMLEQTYGKRERVATAKVQRLVKGGLGVAFGEALLRPQSKGRPRGPSGKYKIEGKPVFEDEYQQWASKQRALNRITPSIAQEAPAQEQVQAMAEEQMQNPEKQYPGTSNPQGPTGEMMNEVPTAIPTQRAPPTQEELKMAQEMAQQQDNILNAPSFLKGELKATGGSLLTPTGPQIMDAPNAFKGQLRTLNRTGEVPAVRLGERPQTNPYGDEYIDIELGSGKPVLKKRPREKWVTGEAL